MVYFRPETAWACAWIDGDPYPFIMSSTVRSSRQAAQEIIGKAWARDGETLRKGWRRAYTNGCRCIKVSVAIEGAVSA